MARVNLRAAPEPRLRTRPVRSESVRHTLTPEVMRQAAEIESAGIKPERVALKATKPVRGGGLKVVGRADNDA